MLKLVFYYYTEMINFFSMLVTNLEIPCSFTTKLSLCVSGLIGWIWKEAEVASLIIFLRLKASQQIEVRRLLGTVETKQREHLLQ